MRHSNDELKNWATKLIAVRSEKCLALLLANIRAKRAAKSAAAKKTTA
jgi:hypothetical protein